MILRAKSTHLVASTQSRSAMTGRLKISFAPLAFYYILSIYNTYVREQIRHKLIDFEGEVKNSRIRAVMRWWSKCISMAIAKTASRNVAFKVARMREFIIIMEDQDEFIIRDSGREEVGSEANNRAALEDIGYNADLYIANQECNTQN